MAEEAATWESILRRVEDERDQAAGAVALVDAFDAAAAIEQAEVVCGICQEAAAELITFPCCDHKNAVCTGCYTDRRVEDCPFCRARLSRPRPPPSP